MRKCNLQKKALRKVLRVQQIKKVREHKRMLEKQHLSSPSAGRVGEILNKIGRQKK